MNRRHLLAAALPVGVAGCTLPPAVSSPSAEELLESAIEARLEMEDLAAVRETVVETPEGTVERTERIRARPPDERRLEVIDSDDPSTPMGTVSVRSREVSWEFDPAAGEVLKRHHPNRIVDDRTRLLLGSLLEDAELAYEGTETVAGRESHVVDATPPEGVEPAIAVLVGDTEYAIPVAGMEGDPEELEVRRRLWLDDEHGIPTRERATVVDDGDPLHAVTFSYEELAVDEGLEPGTFEYEPPDGVEVTTAGTEPEGVFESRTAAAETTPYPIPEPALPEPYELDRITVKEREWGVNTTLWYADPDRRDRELFVVIKEEKRFDPDALEPVDVDGREGHRRDGRILSVFFTCEGLSYEVSDPDADEPVVDVAASIDCG